MKTMLFIATSVLLSVFSSCSSQMAESRSTESPVPDAVSPDNKTRQPVLVELFTSEGCSSCPPADRELIQLETQQPVSGADVITLAFHVDYWDGPAWKDKFSSPAFSERQNQYVQQLNLDSSYTPQMVVDGHSEFVGSNGGEAVAAITKAAGQPKANIGLKAVQSGVEIEIEALPKHEPATIYLAAAEDGLVTNVGGGENGGRKLQHISVVRKLDSVGQLNSGDSSFKATAKAPVDPTWNKDKLKYIVFAQENATGRVIAIGRTNAN